MNIPASFRILSLNLDVTHVFNIKKQVIQLLFYQKNLSNKKKLYKYINYSLKVCM